MASITADPNNPFLINRSGPSISESVSTGIASLAEARERSQALQESQQQAEAQLGLQREAAAESVRQFDVSSGLQERQVALAERQQPISTQNFGLDKVAGFKGMLKGKGVLNGYDTVITDLESMAQNDAITNREVYTQFKTNWPLYRQSTLQSLSKQYDKERDPVVASKILAEMKALNDDKDGQIIDNIMPNVSQELQAEQAALVTEPTFQKTGAMILRDKETGQIFNAVGSFDTKTGTLQTETAELDGFELVSDLGETGIEETAREVGQVGSEAAARGQEAVATELITRGVAAAESTATIRRAMELLDSVETGGFDSVALRAKQIFGIESADEGELSNTLGKAVLSQLRETFGAAFTENEGKRLARIEADFTKSPEANKRLLGQALKLAENTAQRARAAALERGDEITVNDIDDLLSFSLSGTAATPAQAVQPVSNTDFNKLLDDLKL